MTEIARSTFKDAFQDQNNPEDFKAYLDEALGKSAMREQLLNPDSLFYFIYLEEELVGYFKLNEESAQTEYIGKDHMELERIYVRPAHQNKGYGKKIMNDVIRMARSRKARILWLGVWENNHSAIRFYEDLGFIKFGSHPYYVGKDKQTDWMMRLKLD